MNTMCNKILCCLLICVVSTVTCAKQDALPDEYKRCNINGKNYDECFAKAIENSFTLLRQGIPSLGVLSIEPLQITDITMSQGTGAVILTLTFLNASMHNFSNINVLSASNDMKTGGSNINFDFRMPEFTILSNYSMKGHVLFLPIVGDGTCRLVLKNINAKARMQNEIIEKNGEQYISVQHFNLTIIPDEIFLHFDNLFQGDPLLGPQMNTFLNENANEIFTEMRPAIEEAFGEVFKQISNRIFLKVPYKTIFLQ